jgi:TPR repeat protein
VAVTNEPGQDNQLPILLSEARQGNPHSQFKLGVLELTGRCGRIADYALGAKWVFEAAERLPQARYVAAILFSAGTGVRQNETQAHAMLECSAAERYQPAEGLLERARQEGLSIYRLSGAVEQQSNRKVFVPAELERHVALALQAVVSRELPRPGASPQKAPQT